MRWEGSRARAHPLIAPPPRPPMPGREAERERGIEEDGFSADRGNGRGKKLVLRGGGSSGARGARHDDVGGAGGRAGAIGSLWLVDGAWLRCLVDLLLAALTHLLWSKSKSKGVAPMVAAAARAVAGRRGAAVRRRGLSV